MISILISFAILTTILSAITLPLLVDGLTQSSSCANIQLQVETQMGQYESITNNTSLYRPIDATNLTMRCHCINESHQVPSWSLPADHTLTDSLASPECLHVGICIMNETLSFLQLKGNHSGYYKCHVNSISIGFILHVIGPPIIQQPQQASMVPLKSSTITLQCMARGDGSLKYYWERNDSENWITVNNDSRISHIITGTTGQYRCNVTNEVGSVISPVITLYGPPVFRTHPASHIVTVGMNVSLYCNVIGIKVSYVWERRPNGGKWSRIMKSNYHKYDVNNIQQSQQYRCIAGNEAAVAAITSEIATIQVLKITTHPDNKQAVIGSNVTLTCTLSLSSDVKFTWIHNDTIIRTEQVINSDTSRLAISNVRYSDSGSYTCMVWKLPLSVKSNTATITAYVPRPVINIHPVSSKVKALTSVTFTCSVSNVNGVTYSWHRNNGDIPRTRSRGQNTNTLTITRVIPPDEGMYYCIATNDGGSTSSKSASLMVDDELSITVSPLTQTVSEGEVATFNATGRGIKRKITKQFKYEWVKIEGENLITVGRNAQLMINNVKIKDQGTYFCAITNEWNKTKHSEYVHLTVVATSSVFITHPQDQFIHINEDAVFECVVNGSESLTISWRRNVETSSHLNVSNEITSSGRRSILKVKKSRIADSGFYRCVAANADNKVVSSKPAELLILPSINIHPDNVTILTGQSVIFVCGATGTNVVYQWMRNGVLIPDNSNVLIFKDIKQSDDGTYQCIASNKGGNATTNPAKITVYDKPTVNPLPHQTLGVLDEQFQITCNATNDEDAPRNMIFTWMIPDGVDHYVNMTSEDDDHTASSTLYISRLARSDNGTYKCYVTNNNVSNARVVINTTVIVKERPLQPLNFTVTSENATSLKLSWHEPDNFDEEMDYYIIYYSDGKMMKTVNVSNFTGSYALINLTPSTQYSVYVITVRLIGETNETLKGHRSVTDTATTLDDDGLAQSGSNGSNFGIIVGVVVALILAIIIITLILLVYFCKKKGYSKHNVFTNTITKNSINLKENTFGDETKKPLPVNHKSQSSTNATEIMPVINMTYSIEVCTSVGHPTTLPLEVPDVLEENVTWIKDGQRTTHTMLKDGSLYISHTELSDQGDYTAMVTKDHDTSSKAYSVSVIEPEMPLDVSVSHIKVEDFPEHVSLLKSGDKTSLNAEYESLKVKTPFTQYAAKMPVNIAKNRYKNIVAYDHSRVVLSQEKYTVGEDYINASFIDGYGEKKAYIASQGPMTTNFEDFWRMIWEQNVKTVVMLSRLVEDGKYKCDQYWPDSGYKQYGNIKVIAENEVQFANYRVRRFSIEHVSSGRNIKHKVHQFHFSSWPDHGVPIYATAILDFQKRIDKHHKRRTSSPMLVHCSAGVGRTGTFIAIDTEVQRIRQEGVVNVHNCAQKMRYWRNSMIQTLPQYQFVYTALLESITCGDTSIAGAETLKQKVIELSAIDYSVNKTEFQLQFEKLNDNSPKECDFHYTVANSNKKKNRQQKFLPPDSSRVILTDKGGYINACFINGYRHSKAFLVGPGPMKSTVVNFWQMIWENKCCAIVMLGQLQEDKKEASFKYWPNKEENITFGSFSVELVSDDPENKLLIRRIMKVTNAKEKSSPSRTITLLQYQDWSPQSCPENPVHIIDLIEELDCVQRKTGNNAIAVHCSDGVGRSGTFCALLNCVNRFKAEQVVDVFQTIKSMRAQNPAVVQTTEQYEFIHQVIVVLTERYETYANFTVL